MPRKTAALVSESGLTRRAFLIRTAGASLVLLAAGSMSGVLAACAKGPATVDFIAASTTPDPTNHSHNVRIMAADVDNPPSEKVYTSDGESHTHNLTLKKADFEAIRKGTEITVVSSANGTPPHGHTFKIKKPA